MNAQDNALFVAFEGVDGAGKSVAIDYLRNRLLTLEHTAFVIGGHSWADPGSARVIIDMREERTPIDLRQLAEAMRRDKEGWRRYIDTCLRSGISVLADRYILSDLVLLQALFDLHPRKVFESYTQSKIVHPSTVVWLHVEPAVAFDRIVARGRSRRFYETPELIHRMAESYHEVTTMLADRLPSLVVIGNNDPNWKDRMDELASTVWTKHITSMQNRKT